MASLLSLFPQPPPRFPPPSRESWVRYPNQPLQISCAPLKKPNAEACANRWETGKCAGREGPGAGLIRPSAPTGERPALPTKCRMQLGGGRVSDAVLQRPGQKPRVASSRCIRGTCTGCSPPAGAPCFVRPARSHCPTGGPRARGAAQPCYGRAEGCWPVLPGGARGGRSAPRSGGEGCWPGGSADSQPDSAARS